MKTPTHVDEIAPAGLPHRPGFANIPLMRSLRLRALLIVLGAMTMLLIACYLPLQYTQQNNVLKLEQQLVITDIERARQSIDFALQRMSTLVFAYSAWDETYRYISAPNQFYINDNFNPAWMRQSDINIVLLLDSQRNAVYMAYQDLPTQRFLPVPPDLLKLLDTQHQLTTFTAPNQQRTGLLDLQEGPLLYAARPITHSDGSGTPAGTVVFGRFLDAVSVAKLSDLTRFSFSIERLDHNTRLHHGEATAPFLEQTDTIVVPYSESGIEGFGVLRDLTGERSLVLRVDRHRDLYLESRAGMQKAMLAFVLAGALVSVLMTLLIDRVVLLRLLRLNKDVREIGARSNLAARVIVDGRDELGDLAAGINQMLYALECAENQRLAGESEHRTTLEQMNVHLQANLAERQRVEQLKSEFVAVVSHELRTPLTAIRGALGLVNGGVAGEMPEKARAMLAIAYLNSERLVRLVNDILDIEKIEAGRTTFYFQRLMLDPLVRQAIAEHQVYAAQYHVTVEFESNADVCAMVDSDRMLQVLSNLLSNAAKFSSRGSIIAVSLQREGQWAVVSVRDRGMGIPLEFHNRVFERFAQADSSNSRQKSGTGLGLSITKALVEGMNGTISFVSFPGIGTTFRIALPLAE